MSAANVCQCPLCRQPGPNPDKELHCQINLFLSRLDEQQRRWFVALEANRLGPDGVQVMSQITGLDRKTILRGQLELASELAGRPEDRVRLPGAGRPPANRAHTLAPARAACGLQVSTSKDSVDM